MSDNILPDAKQQQSERNVDRYDQWAEYLEQADKEDAQKQRYAQLMEDAKAQAAASRPSAGQTAMAVTEETVKQASFGVMKGAHSAVANTLDTLGAQHLLDASAKASTWFAQNVLQLREYEGRAPQIKDLKKVGGETQNPGAKFVQGATQFMVPYAALAKVGKFMQAARHVNLPKIFEGTGVASKVAKSVTAGAVVDMVAFDPYEQKATDALLSWMDQEPGTGNAVLEFLRTDPNDRESMARLKRGLEGAALGVVIDPVVEVLAGWRTLFFKKAQDAGKTVDETIEQAKADSQAYKTQRPDVTMIDDPAAFDEAWQPDIKATTKEEAEGMLLDLQMEAVMAERKARDAVGAPKDFPEQQAAGKTIGEQQGDAAAENAARDAQALDVKRAYADQRVTARNQRDETLESVAEQQAAEKAAMEQSERNQIAELERLESEGGRAPEAMHAAETEDGIPTIVIRGGSNKLADFEWPKGDTPSIDTVVSAAMSDTPKVFRSGREGAVRRSMAAYHDIQRALFPDAVDEALARIAAQQGPRSVMKSNPMDEISYAVKLVAETNAAIRRVQVLPPEPRLPETVAGPKEGRVIEGELASPKALPGQPAALPAPKAAAAPPVTPGAAPETAATRQADLQDADPLRETNWKPEEGQMVYWTDKDGNFRSGEVKKVSENGMVRILDDLSGKQVVVSAAKLDQTIEFGSGPFMTTKHLMQIARDMGRLRRALDGTGVVQGATQGAAFGALMGASEAAASEGEDGAPMPWATIAAMSALGALGGHRLMRNRKPKAPPKSANGAVLPDSPLGNRMADPNVANISPKTRKVKATDVNVPADRVDVLVDAAMRGNMSDLAANLKEQDFNFLNLIDDEGDLETVIDGFSAAFSKQIDSAKRGKVSFGQIEEFAADLGADVKSLQGLRRDTNYLAERVLPHRVLLMASAKKTRDMAQQALGGDDAIKLAFRKQVMVHAAIQAKMKGVQTEIARALSSFRIKAGPESMLVDEIDGLLAVGGGPDVAQELAKKFAAYDDPRMINGMARKALNVRTMDGVLEVFIQGALSNPITHAANIVSNSLVAANALWERGLAAGFGKLMRTNPEEAVKLEEVRAMTVGYRQGLMEALHISGKGLEALQEAGVLALKGRTREARDTLAATDAGDLGETWRTLGTGENALDNTAFGTLDGRTANNAAITSELFGADPSGALGRGIDTFGALVRTPGRALASSDELFKTINYRGELHAQAYKIARSENLEGSALATRIAEIVEDPTDELRAIALDAARQNTFTNKLGTLGRSFQGTVNKIPHGLGRFIFPFIRTPINLMTYQFQRNPLTAMLYKSMREDIAAGGVKRDIAMAKLANGSLILSAAVLTPVGLITGGGERHNGAERLGGWQKYSFKIGNEYVSFNRMDPLAGILGVGADLRRILPMVSEEEGSKLLGAAALAFSNNVLSKSYLSGMVELFDAIHMSTMSGNGKQLSKWFQRQALTATLPASGLMRNLRNRNDEQMREVYTMIDNYYNTIPGLSSKLPPIRNVFGEPIEVPEGMGPDMISPFLVSKENDSPAAKELMRLDIDLEKPEKSIALDHRLPRVDLTPAQYDKYVKLAGEPFKKWLEEFVKSPDYKNIPEFDGEVHGMKEAMIAAYYARFKNQAKQRLLAEDDALRDHIDGVKRSRLGPAGTTEVPAFMK